MLRIFLCEGVSVGLLFGEFLFYEAEKKEKKTLKQQSLVLLLRWGKSEGN